MFLNRYKDLEKYWKRIRVKDDPAEGTHSKFIYVEDYYQYDLSGELKSKINMLQIQLVICFVIVFCFLLTRRVSINSIPFIGGFGMIAAAAEVFCIIGVISFLRIDENMTIMDFKRVRGMIFYGACRCCSFLSRINNQLSYLSYNTALCGN